MDDKNPARKIIPRLGPSFRFLLFLFLNISLKYGV